MKHAPSLTKRSNAELLGILAREDGALQQEVKHLIQSNPGRFIADLEVFLGLQEEHLLLLLGALKGKEATETLLWDWAALLTFLEKLLSDPAQKNKPQVVQEVGHFLHDVLNKAYSFGLYVQRRMHPAVRAHQQILIRLLTLMLQGPAPRATDPTGALPNEMQDLAFDALLTLGFVLQTDLSKDEPPGTFRLQDHPGLDRIFLQVLHSPLSHAKFSKSIHLLEHLDWTWLLGYQHEVFPDAEPQRYDTTLQAYLRMARLSALQVEHLKVFPPLLDALVTGELEGENLWLLSKLVHLLKFGELPVSSWVIQKVFNEGPLEVRFEFLRQLGRTLTSRDHDEWVDHALVLWAWRKSQVLAGQAETEELEAFESWLHAEMHENQKLTELLFVLTHTGELKRLRPEIVLTHLSYSLQWEPLLTTQVLKVLTERHTLTAELRLQALSLLKQALGFRTSQPLAKETLEGLSLRGWMEKHPPEVQNDPEAGGT